MKKWYLFGFLVTLCSGWAYAQTAFREMTFQEALQAAKTENKMVLIDCYTSWCGPCKMMAAKEFPKKEMGDYINPNFVPLKMDMEKGDGVTVRERYDVNAFPTYLVLDSNGELKYRLCGYLLAEKFIEQVKEGLGGAETELMKMMKRYQLGERSEAFIVDYLFLLKANYMSGEIKKVISEKLKDADANTLVTNKTDFMLFKNYIDTKDDPVFQRMYRGKNLLIDQYGEEAKQKFEEVLKSYPYNFCTFDGHQLVAFDYDKLDAYLEQLKADGMEKVNQLGAYFRYYAASVLKTPEEALKWVKEYAKEGVTDSRKYFQMLNTLCSKGMENEVRPLAETHIAALEEWKGRETSTEAIQRIDYQIKMFRNLLSKPETKVVNSNRE